MTEAEAKGLMERHGITKSQQAVYYYRGFKYGNLVDAVTYAERNAARDHELGARQATVTGQIDER